MKRSLFILCIMFGLLGCASIQGTDNSASPLEQYEVVNTRAEVTEDDFIYRLVTEKGEYHENDSANIYAELEYIGDKEEVTIFHAASPFYFPMVEKTRGIEIDYPMKEVGVTTTLKKGQPLREQYKRSGGYASQDNKEYAAFMKSFLEDGFPAGYYVVNGFAHFYLQSIENDESKEAFTIQAQIDFKVQENK
jgi:hypothetical protein